jgi:hypothetical protein
MRSSPLGDPLRGVASWDEVAAPARVFAHRPHVGGRLLAQLSEPSCKRRLYALRSMQ